MQGPGYEFGWRMGWIVAGFASICTLLALALAGRNAAGEQWPLGRLIYEYQTLITGLLALFAALATVTQMQVTDKEQERRHAEALAASREGDRRKLERALHPQLTELKIVLENLLRIDLDPARFAGGRSDPHWATLSDIGAAYSQETHELIAILGRQQFVDGEVMFDGRTARILSILVSAATAARSIVDTHLQTEEPRLPSWYADYDADFDGPALFAPLRALPGHLSDFIEEMLRIEPSVTQELPPHGSDQPPPERR